jgi:hypothetical protein
MSINKSKIKLFLILFTLCNLNVAAYSQTIILSKCKNLKDGFIKNEYILDLEKSLMTRNYIYDSKTFKKYRITDLSVKKENSIERFIYKYKNFILTDKAGYPQFYTQLVFQKNNPVIMIKTVINNEAATSKMSTCSKITFFEKES